jgi:MFS family permease
VRDRRRTLVLGLLCSVQFVLVLDVTIVAVALPSLRDGLGFSAEGLQWVVSAYVLAFAGFLLLGGRAADLWGRRRLFLAGLATFAGASGWCGLAGASWELVAARAVQGVGAAVVAPAALSLLTTTFAEGAARERALGVWTAAAAGGGATGFLLGGVLTQALGWRAVFLVNVPVGVAAAVLVPRLVPADHVPGGRRLDLPGLLTASGAVLLVVLPLVLGHEQGWPAWTWASLAAGVLLAGVFVLVERSVAARGGDPLLHLGVLRAPGLQAGLAALTAAMVAYGGFLFTLVLHLQLGLGDSALRAGLTFAPGAAAFGAMGYWWRRLPSRVHHALTPVGLAVGALAYVGLAANLHAGTRGGPWLFVLLVAYGAAFGAAFSPLITQALVHVPRSQAADASGLVTTTIQLSQVVGVAVFGSLFLSLATHPGAHASAAAFSTVELWLAALTLVGVVGAVLLARTVRAAMRAATTS